MPRSAGTNSRRRNGSESGFAGLFGRMLHNRHVTEDPNISTQHTPAVSSPSTLNDGAPVPLSSRPDNDTNNDTPTNGELEEGTALPVRSIDSSASTSHPRNPASSASPNTDTTTVDANTSSQLSSIPHPGRKDRTELDVDDFTRLQVAVLVRMPTPPHPASTSFVDAKSKAKCCDLEDLGEEQLSASSCGSTLDDDGVDQVPVLEIGLVDVGVYPGLGLEEGG